MRLGLRAKILVITVLTPLTLGLVALVVVHRNVQEHVDSSSIHEGLQHSVRVFEGMLDTRGKALAGGGAVIARDPRFFSLLTLGVGQRDSRFTATMRGMAHDFNGITQTELFEVIDRRGRPLVSVGSIQSQPGARDALVRSALGGKPDIGVVVIGRSQYQVSATPVRADGRVIGVLLLGSEIGDRLAKVLRAQMRCEVTFVTRGVITASTLEQPGDKQALIAYLEALRHETPRQLHDEPLHKVRGAGLTYITVVQPIPGGRSGMSQLYVMQRAFDPEVLFLQQMQRDLVMIALVAVVAALLTGFILSGQITRPIEQLVRAAQEMQRGNYTYPVTVRSSDEIGFLTRRLLEMRQRERVYVGSLEEATRLKSEFINVASHELRTPISVIEGYRDLIEGGTLGPVQPKQRQALEAMRTSLKSLTQIAERALQVAQVHGERLHLSVSVEPMSPMLARAVGDARAEAPSRQVRIESQIDPALETFPMDAEMMIMAVTHLVSNAIRFTPDGGRIDLVAHERDDHLEIIVGDEGPGIPPERLSRLFEHGYAVHDPLGHHSSDGLEFNSRGLGMGLAITRGIVEAHGGTVSAKNRPEKGTEFVIRIPRVEGAAPGRAA
jgi:signal transduction histidine kinase